MTKMITGDIILVPFPFAELKDIKVRPAVVLAETKDKYKDVVVSAISSVVPVKLTPNEILLQPNKINNLRIVSIIKVDRIVTIKKEIIITKIGKLSDLELEKFIYTFKNLV